MRPSLVRAASIAPSTRSTTLIPTGRPLASDAAAASAAACAGARHANSLTRDRCCACRTRMEDALALSGVKTLTSSQVPW